MTLEVLFILILSLSKDEDSIHGQCNRPCFEGLTYALSPLEGERVGRGGCSSTILTLAFLAKAAVQQATFRLSERVWVPAFAGKTEKRK